MQSAFPLWRDRNNGEALKKCRIVEGKRVKEFAEETGERERTEWRGKDTSGGMKEKLMES